MATEGQDRRELVPEIEAARTALRRFDNVDHHRTRRHEPVWSVEAYGMREALAGLLAWLDRGQER